MKQLTKINLKNIQATPAAQSQENKRPNQKMGQRTKQTVLQRRHTDGSVQFSSIQSLSRVLLCDPMNHSMPGLPVHHQLLEFTQRHEKMLNITQYQRSANQNHNEVQSHAGHNGYYQKVYKQMLERMWRKGNPLTLLWECKLVQPLWKTVWRFLKKLEIELPYDPEIPLLGIHTEETRSERDTCTLMFIAALFIIARTSKQPRCPSELN